MRCGGTPEPVHAPPAVVFDDVTNGYVPWSMSKNVPCAPSNKRSLPRRMASWSNTTVFATNGFKYFPAALYSAKTCLNDSGFAPSDFRTALFSLMRAESFSWSRSGLTKSLMRRPTRAALSP